MTLRLAARLPLVVPAPSRARRRACGGKRPPALADAQPGRAARAPASDAAGAAAARRPSTKDATCAQCRAKAPTGADIAGGAASSGEGGPLADIHFEFDSSTLTDEARATLEKHALWLQGQRGAHVTIEGHCDERGTVEYNLALGEQRARAARDYLVSLGVAADRLHDRLLRQGAAARHRPRRGGLGQEPPGPLRRPAASRDAPARRDGSAVPAGTAWRTIVIRRIAAAPPARGSPAGGPACARPTRTSSACRCRSRRSRGSSPRSSARARRRGPSCKRLTELVAEQNALLQRAGADGRQQDEALATASRS